MTFITNGKKRHVNSLNETYATVVLHEAGARELHVTEDGYASLHDAGPRTLNCRSELHLRSLLNRLETSRGGIAIFFS